MACFHLPITTATSKQKLAWHFAYRFSFKCHIYLRIENQFKARIFIWQQRTTPIILQYLLLSCGVQSCSKWFEEKTLKPCIATKVAKDNSQGCSNGKPFYIG